MFRFCEREKSSSQICLLVGGIEPPTRYVAQGLTWHCDEIVTLSVRLGASYHGPRPWSNLQIRQNFTF